MSVTGIKTYENKVAVASPSTVGGEIAVLLDAEAGKFNTMYTVSNATEFRRIFGVTSDNTKNNDGYSRKNYYEFCNYLLNRGNVLRIVRAGVDSTGLVPASLDVTKGNLALKFTAIALGDYYNDIYLEFKAVNSKYFSLNIKYAPDEDTSIKLETYPVLSLNSDDEYFIGNLSSSIVSVAVTGEYTDENLGEDESDYLENGSTITVGASAKKYYDYQAHVAYNSGEIIIYDKKYYGLISSISAANNNQFSDLSTNELTSEVANPEVKAAYSALAALSDREFGFTTLLLMCAVPSIEATSSPDNTAVYYVDQLLAERQRDFVYLDNYELYAVEDDSISKYYPKVKVPSLPYMIPNGIVVADKYAELEKANMSYKAPAGIPNGVLTDVVDIEKIFSKAEVEELQESGKNPIVVKQGTGVVIWGQSTYTTNPLAVQRLAVRLFVNYLKRTVYQKSQKYIFMDHTELTWNQWKNEMEPLVRDVYNVGGLLNYRVVCDRTIMTQEDIENGKMKGLIIIQPPYQINEIEVTFSIDESGVSFE